MKVLPLNPTENASPEALLEFLEQCRQEAIGKDHAQLVSISITVDALDPLAVLETIYEASHPHFYAEHPSEGTAIAGAEVALELKTEGADRFAQLQRFADETFANAIGVGSVSAPFGGPHIFVAAAFADVSEPGEPFPALTAFVPHWQVARAGDSTTAVANFVVGAESDVVAVAARVLRAHQRFSSFGVDARKVSSAPEIPTSFSQSESQDYCQAVTAGLARIQAGEFNKIVLARAVDLKSDRALPPLEALNGLRERFPECFSFSVANGRGDNFIGASPERLVRVSQGVMEADVLAGTIQRGRGAAADAARGAELRASSKDQHEHRLVLESIVRRLTQLDLVPEFPDSPHLRKLANLQHLHTPVRAALKDGVNLLDVLAVLHPTPAVGGSPREAAVKSIRAIEGFPRGLYAGALGWMNARGGGEFMVGIRSALLTGSTARAYAGAGIVKGSDPEKERAETDLKFRALLEGLKSGV
ncbi:MAG: isochorismate synthase [Synoicihabitans sp.]